MHGVEETFLHKNCLTQLEAGEYFVKCNGYETLILEATFWKCI